MLGPLLVTVDGRAVALGAAKQRTLLAALALDAGRPVSSQRLMDCLWGQHPPATARATLHSYVRRLRLALGSPPTRFVQSVPDGYRLDGGAARLDLLRFRELTASAARRAGTGDVAGQAAHLRDAMALWRGPVLADVTSEVLQREEAPLLTEERLDAHERLIDAELRLGQYRGVVADLRELTAGHPLRERFWGQQMIALHGAGRTAEALAVYQRARERLAQELGLDPGEDLRLLEAAILKGRTAPELVSETIGPVLGGPIAVVTREPVACPVIPRQLPFGIGAVVGREPEAGALSETLRAGAGAATSVPVAVISGRAGVGKTALAVHVAHLLAEDFPDGQLYVDLRRADGQRLEPERALARLLTSLGVDRRRMPEGLDERADLYRDIVSGRRILVVLDDAVDEAQVRPLLPGSSSCAVLVTSQKRLGGLDVARLVELGVLPPRQALELLRRVLGHGRTASDLESAKELVRLCGGLPLAVRIAAARLVAKQHWPLAYMVSRLRDESTRLDELVHGEMDVRARLARSHGDLDDIARTVFYRLGLFPRADFGPRAAAAITDLDEIDAQAALERLVDARIVEVVGRSAPGEIRYRLPDLVRLLAQEHAWAGGGKLRVLESRSNGSRAAVCP